MSPGSQAELYTGPKGNLPTGQVPKEECLQVPKKSCNTVSLESCQQIPKDDCRSLPKENCSDSKMDLGDLGENEELVLVNGRLFRSNKYIPSKSRIFMYADKFSLGKPEFTLTVLNDGNAEWITYKARLTLENKVSEA